MFQGRRKSLMITWLLVFMILIIAVITGLSSKGEIATSGAALATLLSVIFALLQGTRRYTWKGTLIFLLITFVFGNFYENLSIATGFPFGNYYYTSALGPKFIYTPLFINIAYFQMALIAWNLSGPLIDHYSNQTNSHLLIIQPLVASFIMVMWDMVIDPWSSTVSHAWRWKDGGAYFGVPFSNYLGWFLCVFSIFFVFSLYTKYFQKDTISNVIKKRSYWIQMIIVYYSWVILLMLKASNTPFAQTVTDLAGQNWHLQQIYQVGGLVGLYSVIPIGLLTLIKVFRRFPLS
ncbi:hypothetical protein FC19_GL001138 [Liquorilactobacillus aquaticus DSM 21051]|uniref:Carotenoid biosynthesis protein n=1 Tax=Liquorilactobacillus aquaticus DSM 21051 TaxID=1423725 RepID=A0A0R2D6N3_9LACO|nr:carotenoid biosynthesis protein [Liquorilactobacillus aquaticus]KRM96070.1 hypothetical protein FC19_GL001138 [Liquorilactobacillus aquaticus DSM 21051]